MFICWLNINFLNLFRSFSRLIRKGTIPFPIIYFPNIFLIIITYKGMNNSGQSQELSFKKFKKSSINLKKSLIFYSIYIGSILRYIYFISEYSLFQCSVYVWYVISVLYDNSWICEYRVSPPAGILWVFGGPVVRKSFYLYSYIDALRCSMYDI